MEMSFLKVRTCVLIMYIICPEYVVRWKTELDNKPKLYLLQQYKMEFPIEAYCKLNLKWSQRSLIAKLRLGILPLKQAGIIT